MAENWTGVSLRDPERIGYQPSRPYVFGCPKKNCYYYVGTKSEADALEIQRNHKCPHSGTTKIGWTVTKTLVEQMWEKLDTQLVSVMEGISEPTEQLVGRARARAIAECIAIFMPPHFTTADEVAKEAVARYKAKKAGDDTYETAGMGQRRYEGPAEWIKAKGGWTSDPQQGERGTGTSARRTPKTQQVHLSEEEQKAIVFAFESGMFPIKRLAQTYKVSEAVINEILNAKKQS